MNHEKATFAAGCFWGVEEAFRTLPGVAKTTVGYTGGQTSSPTYKEVCSGATGHAEAVEIEFDPAQISYAELLAVFWKSHNPTQKNRQGADVGSQYRSAIFYHTPEQRDLAETSRDELVVSGRFSQPIATIIERADAFYPAEDYHQQYLAKRGEKSCHL